MRSNAPAFESVGRIGKGSGWRWRRRPPEPARGGRRAAYVQSGSMPLFPIVLVVHVALALGLLAPSILLPFALRGRRPAAESSSRIVRALLVLQARGTVYMGLGLAATGLTLVALLGPSLLGQPWLLVALCIYATNLAVAYFIQRPNLRRLVGVRIGVRGDDVAWLSRARRQRYVSYAMAALGGAVGFLMSTKPALW